MLAAVALLGHTGHALDGIGAGVLHPLGGIDHLLAMAAVGILAAALAHRRLAWATPAAFVAGMVAGGWLGIAGVGAGFVETTIAVSLIALGGLITTASRPEVGAGAWVPVVALGFGAVHGIAHGGEVPASGSPLGYVAGFVAATVLLHLSGVAIGSTVGRRPAVRTAIAGMLSVAGVAILAGVPG